MGGSVGRVQAMLQLNVKQYGVLRQTIDLFARTMESWRGNPNNPHIQVLLQYYRKHHGWNVFNYDHTDSKWIDLNCMCILTMSYNSTNEVYTLDMNNSEQLSEFVT